MLWPDASQDSDSDIARLLQPGKAPHSGVTRTPAQGLPLSLARLFDPRTLNQINAGSSLIAAVLAVLLIATAPEEFGVPECTSTMEAAGLEGPHRWGIIQFRCIVLKPRRQHVSTHGYTIMEQPVARDLFQSEAAGIMLVEPQQSSNNSLCSHPVASNTSQSGITCHKLQKR